MRQPTLGRPAMLVAGLLGIFGGLREACTIAQKSKLTARRNRQNFARVPSRRILAVQMELQVFAGIQPRICVGSAADYITMSRPLKRMLEVCIGMLILQRAIGIKIVGLAVSSVLLIEHLLGISNFSSLANNGFHIQFTLIRACFQLDYAYAILYSGSLPARSVAIASTLGSTCQSAVMMDFCWTLNYQLSACLPACCIHAPKNSRSSVSLGLWQLLSTPKLTNCVNAVRRLPCSVSFFVATPACTQERN